MARGRMISKAISLDEKVNELPDDTARLLFTWMISHLDREGRLHGDATTVKSIIFPRRNISVTRIETYLKKMEDLKLILRFSVNGNLYLFAPHFEEHQTGLQKNREAPSQIPPPPPDLIQSSDRVVPQNPVPKSKLKIKSKYNTNKEAFVLPDFINKEIWDAFLEIRKKKKAASTDYALSLIIKDLEKFRASGDDPNEILKKSIMGSWKGVFPLDSKGGQGGSHQQSSRKLPTTYRTPEEIFGTDG